MSTILSLVQFLPSLLQLGVVAAPLAGQLITTVTGNASATTEVEKYANTFLAALPAAINAGVDIYNVVTHERAVINRMLDQGRGPTTEEWTAQAESIAALEAAWKDASKAP